jgi:hypothetical protein
MRRIWFLLALGAAPALCADLPVKQVALYKHGVGYFERAGKLAAGESARLDFDASEMNDVLKSLVIEEQGGGKISGLRYDSMDPLSHKLAEFPFQIGSGQPLALMLDQLKGARLELKLGAETVSGVIVTGRVVGATDKQAERDELTLLLDSGELRMLDLGSATGVHFTDAKLQAQFKEYLAALADSRSKDKRSVYIDSSAGGARDIVASYTIPTAVWKSSYRLIFPASGQPTLEGWAIVDNTTDEDWDGIHLSLVSGMPISFVSQLYAPRYVDRPTAELPEDRAARPVLHEGAYEAASADQALAVNGNLRNGTGTGGGVGSGVGGGVGGVGGRAPTAMANRQMPAPPPAPSMSQMVMVSQPSTIVSAASAEELGELFEYVIPQPVTIRKNESAMLPFLQQQISARKLLIYSDRTSQHPTNAAELTNTSGKTLDGGPITVYDAGAYGGEALMETLKAGDKRLISYAVDLGTRITTAFDTKSAVVREIHANRGVLTTRMAAEQTTTYTIRNVDQKAKTLILEHAIRSDFTLLNQKPAEKTASAYRFEIPVAAGATQAFPVSEERVFDQTYQVTSLTPDAILAYVQNRGLSDAGRTALERIASQKSAIADNARALAATASRISDLTADEDRIRNNIASLNAVSGQQQQVQNYARQIEEHEQQLAALRDTQADQQKKETALEADLGKLMDALAF